MPPPFGTVNVQFRSAGTDQSLDERVREGQAVARSRVRHPRSRQQSPSLRAPERLTAVDAGTHAGTSRSRSLNCRSRAGQRRLPVGVECEIRLRVASDHAVEHFAADAAADLAQPVARVTCGRLAQDVEPERRLARPSVCRATRSLPRSRTSAPSTLRDVLTRRGVPCPGRVRDHGRRGSGTRRRRSRR